MPPVCQSDRPDLPRLGHLATYGHPGTYSLRVPVPVAGPGWWFPSSLTLPLLQLHCFLSVVEAATW